MPGPEKIGEFGIWYVVFLFTLTLHEAAHAFVAWLGGDSTAYHGGQVTLNPWPHVRREIFGTVVFPLLTFFASGWMMGWASTPFDPTWARRHPRRQAAMSAAGPGANLLLALAAFVALKALLGAGLFVPPHHVSFGHVVEPAAGTPQGSLAFPIAFCLSVLLNLNVLLFLFNLIPLPPLDGTGIVQGLFPGTLGPLFESLTRNPMMSMFGLMVAWRLFDVIYPPAFDVLLQLLHPDFVYR
ncbi:MAG TPA: site-2 protease family protein [Candidatus Polarisedimenticolia bacterium]|nr:site-2 protease family protein [Candidatus Polarisedimenticolia bacterium]